MNWLLELITWPFKAVFYLVVFIVELLGRFLASLLGIIFVLVGAILCLTIVGAIVGIPLILVGFSLIGVSLRSSSLA